MEDITSDDLTRLRYHASMVKGVVIDPTRVVVRLEAHEWTTLLAHIGPPDFPNLTFVRTWQNRLLNTPHHPPPVYHLLGESLRSLHIERAANSIWYTEGPDDRDNPENLISIYTHIHLRSPRLENLSVIVDKFCDDIAGPLMESICGLHNLLHCTLEGVFVTPCVLSHLASLPFLQTLSIRTRGIDFADGLDDTLSTVVHPFPELRRSILVLECMPICTELMRAIRSSKLNQITVTIAKPVSVGELVAFSSTLSGHPSSGTLEILNMVLGNLANNAAILEPLPPSEFLPFASLHRLREFTVSGPTFAGLDDATLLAMAHGWPEIRKAWMVPILRPVASITARATLSVLNAFIKHCPHVIELGFELEDVTREAVEAVIKAQTRPQGVFGLITLGVGSSYLATEDCHTVASLLSLWCPERAPDIYSWTYKDRDQGVEENIETLYRLDMAQRHWYLAGMWSDRKFWKVRVEERLWRRRQKRLMTWAADVVSDPSSAL